MANSENTRQKSHSKDDEIDLRQIWDVLSFNKYKIIASGGVGLLLAVVYVLLALRKHRINQHQIKKHQIKKHRVKKHQIKKHQIKKHRVKKPQRHNIRYLLPPCKISSSSLI